MKSRNIYFIYRNSDGMFYSREDRYEIYAYRTFERAKIFVTKPSVLKMLNRLGKEGHTILSMSLSIHTVEKKSA